jgi:hypothetical protein
MLDLPQRLQLLTSDKNSRSYYSFFLQQWFAQGPHPSVRFLSLSGYRLKQTPLLFEWQPFGKY